MPAQASSCDRFRVMSWMAGLMRISGLSCLELERLYFRKYAAKGLEKSNTGRFAKYLSGIGCIVDPDANGVLSAPMAMELEFPTSSLWLFHPLWNLLDSQLRSTKEWLKANGDTDKLDVDLTKERSTEQFMRGWLVAWANFAREKPSKVALPNSCIQLSASGNFGQNRRTHQIHGEMLRCGGTVRGILFHRDGFEAFRRYGPAEDEARSMCAELSLDRLTGAVGMLMEAREIEDPHRIHVSSELVTNLLQVILLVPDFEKFKSELISLCLLFRIMDVHPYDRRKSIRQSLPQSWACDSRFKHLLECDMEPESDDNLRGNSSERFAKRWRLRHGSV
jgi:hypothetical protein